MVRQTHQPDKPLNLTLINYNAFSVVCLASRRGFCGKLPQVFGKPTVFLSAVGLRIKCGNSSLVPRFCVAKSNPCGILKSTQRFFCNAVFSSCEQICPCGQFCKEVIERLAPATCEAACSFYKQQADLLGTNVPALGSLGGVLWKNCHTDWENLRFSWGGGRFAYTV